MLSTYSMLTKCSRPSATKAEMGNQLPTALPGSESAARACAAQSMAVLDMRSVWEPLNKGSHGTWNNNDYGLGFQASCFAFVSRDLFLHIAVIVARSTESVAA